MNYHIKKNNFSKDGNTTKTILEERLGYTIEDLKNHLENKFTKKNGYTWENYGTYWEIDHIIPASWFKYKNFDDIQFNLCWCLGNLQPLEKIKNMSKCNRFASNDRQIFLV